MTQTTINAVLERPVQTIKVKVTETGFSEPNTKPPVVLKNASLRFDQMADVIEAGATDNAVPVYNAETDKYEVRQLNIDGGIF